MAALNFEEDEVISEINIVPFVDIVLVLLIIVMVTSTALVKASFEVKLPKAASAGQTVESTLNIVMTRDGQLFLNGEETTKADVVGYIRVELPKSPKMQAVIPEPQLKTLSLSIEISFFLKMLVNSSLFLKVLSLLINN